jgi:NTP pyrophosphatase (non-canonical NTP hydrolase)
MHLNQYQAGCTETWTGDNRVQRAFLGLAGEVGEVMECRKKYLRGDYNHATYSSMLKKELGDTLFYLAITAFEEGIDLNDVGITNYEKLKSRKERGTIEGSGDLR